MSPVITVLIFIVILGITKLSDFSTDIYAFNLKSMTGWKKVAVRGGKSAPFKFYGHTSVYSRYTKSLIIFGGEAATSEWLVIHLSLFVISYDLECFKVVSCQSF